MAIAKSLAGASNIRLFQKALIMSRRNAGFASAICVASCLVAGLLLARDSDVTQPQTANQAAIPGSNFATGLIAEKSTSGMDHAKLANEAVAQRQADRALAELKEAERLGSANSFEYESKLFAGYCNLHQVAPAIEHGQRCVALGKASGVKSETIDSIESCCRDFEARLVPTYFDVAAPTNYSIQEFHEALGQKLSTEEAELVVNPLASTLKMASWAHELTAGGKDDVEKARMLFEGLIHRLDGPAMRPLTAEEVFDSWNNPEVSFHCQEYGFLYTSLARAAGLRAFVVYVQETCYGEKTDHACAAVFIGKRALLVDPAYFWFGVPHKRFQVLDDLGTTALFLSSFVNMERAQIACKLAPDFPGAQSDLFCAFVGEGRWEEAKSLLPKMKQLDPYGWGTYITEARMALHENRYDAAAELLAKAIKINPSSGAAYVYLGDALLRLGRSDDARNTEADPIL